MKSCSLLSCILFFFYLNGFTQNKHAIELYNKGVEAFEKEEYKTADSLFTASIKLEPHPDTYFNLAATKNKLGDHCGFCDNLLEASNCGDSVTVEIYRKNCIQTQKILYQNILESNVIYYCVVTNQSCLNKKTYRFFKKHEQTDSINSFIIIKSDTSKFKNKDFLSPFFDIENVPKENLIYLYDEMPSYPSGDEACLKFIQNNLHYPKKALKYNITGIVFVTFIVEADGSLTNVKLLKGIGAGCNEEAIRLVKMMPKWNPGKSNGKNISVKYYIPIKFKIKVYNKNYLWGGRMYE